MKEELKGRFIVLDGPDGCGKSTQAGLLAEWIASQGIAVARFRDPGDTVVGEQIRHILLDPDHDRLCTHTEVMLYMAARTQLWSEKLAPALAEGRCVVMDRWVSSTCAYQGYAGRFGIDNVVSVASVSLEKVWPDLTIILDVDQQTASARMDRRLDRMEQKGAEYHSNVRKGFLELVNMYDRVVRIDASVSVEDVHSQIRRVIGSVFAE